MTKRRVATSLAALLAPLLVALAGFAASAPPAEAVAGFGDVAPTDYYARPVAWMVTEHLTTGTGIRRFDPDRAVDRAQLATFLWREAGQPAAAPSGFADVPGGVYYSRAVGWLRATGLTTGAGSTNLYRPGRVVTRGELATFLWRQAGSPRVAGDAGFVDVSPTAYYATAVRWMAATGLTTGVAGTNRFEPSTPLTRGQVATFLYRRAGSPPVDPALLRVDPPPPPPPVMAPPHSGTGRRIVYSNSAQRVWLVNSDNTVHKTYLVSGRYHSPGPGTYHVYSKSPLAWAGHDGITMRWMIRFAWGNTAAIGFHAIPRYANGQPMQTEAELGQYRSAGCVRQADADALYLWAWAPIGTTVVVLW